MRRAGSVGLVALIAFVTVVAARPRRVDAEPYRLRADALAGVQAPVGLLTLEASGRPRDWLSAESLVWLGASGEGSDAEALVIAVRARDPRGRGEARLGRFVLSLGALRPLHLDGALATAHLPSAFVADVFAGMPVVPDAEGRAWDWAVGGRVGRRLGDWGSVGLAWMERRDHGRLADEELAVDAGASPVDDLDLGGRVSYDLVTLGLSELQLAMGVRTGALRWEAFGVERSPSRLLPATSLFSVLGDVPSRRVGAGVGWRAAPRLDLRLDGGVRIVGDGTGEDLAARALLRLDERGDGVVIVEGRRDGSGGWTGARGSMRLPLTTRVSLATELELAVPDVADGRGALWAWGLVGASWRPAPAWEAGLAVEAGSSPEHLVRVDALARLTRRWEGR